VAHHAVAWVLYRAVRMEVACYNYEISSLRLEAAMWQSLYGPGGKPDPHTELETELNEILQLAYTDAGRLVSGIQSRCTGRVCVEATSTRTLAAGG
jgi:hypothetical protein